VEIFWLVRKYFDLAEIFSLSPEMYSLPAENYLLCGNIFKLHANFLFVHANYYVPTILGMLECCD